MGAAFAFEGPKEMCLFTWLRAGSYIHMRF